MGNFKEKLIVLYFIFGGILLFTGCSGGKKSEVAEENTSLVQAKKAELVGKLSWRGIVRSAERIEVRTDRDVKIAKVHVANFSMVKKGQLLIEMDQSENEQKLAELQETLKTQSLEHESAKAKYEFREKAYERKLALVKKEIIAQKEFDKAKQEYRIGETEVKAKALEVGKLQQQITELGEQIKASSYLSPMDGMVSGLVSIEINKAFRPGQLLAIVSNPEKPALWIKVEENYIHRISNGMEVVVVLDAFGKKELKGSVFKIDLAGSDAGASKIKTYDVGIEFKSEENMGVREGFSGSSEFVYASKKDALTVPLNAIRYLDGKDFVVVASGRKGIPRPVKLGLKTEMEAEILEGLKEGESVLIDLY